MFFSVILVLVLPFETKSAPQNNVNNLDVGHSFAVQCSGITTGIPFITNSPVVSKCYSTPKVWENS